MSVAAGSRSDAPDPIQPHRFARMRPQPSDLDPMDLDRVNSSQPVKPAASPGNFAKKSLSFFIFTKIPFHLRSFLTVQSFFFILAQNLFESLQIGPYTFPKP
jgi:hypothetical protein